MTDPIFSDCSTSDDDPMALLGQPDTAPAAAPAVERWLISRLRPNQFNSEVFSDSLGAESISQLAESMQAHGQLSPIVVTPQGVIVDGERRWRAATQLGLSHVTVVVAPHTEQSIRAIVLDACTGTRHLSLREQTSVYCALLEHLRERHGRPHGRPGKTISDEILFWDPEQIKTEAAKRAGFSSVTQAAKAQAVFARGSADLQEQVNREEVSLTAAYDQLEKRPRATRQSDPPVIAPGTAAVDQQASDPIPVEAISSSNEPAHEVPAAPAGDERSAAKPVTGSPASTPLLQPVAAGQSTQVTGVAAQAPTAAQAPELAPPDPPAEKHSKREILDDGLRFYVEFLERIYERNPSRAQDIARGWAERLMAAANWPPHGDDALTSDEEEIVEVLTGDDGPPDLEFQPATEASADVPPELLHLMNL